MIYWLKKLIGGYVFFADVMAMAIVVPIVMLIAPQSDLMMRLCNRLNGLDDQGKRELEEMNAIIDARAKDREDKEP